MTPLSICGLFGTHQKRFYLASHRISQCPKGGLFYDLMFLPSVLMIPISLVFGPVFSANIWIVLSCTGIGYCTYLLSQHVTQDRMSSMVAGWLALSSPYLLGYPLTGGVYERLGVWMFPLVLYGT